MPIFKKTYAENMLNLYEKCMKNAVFLDLRFGGLFGRVCKGFGPPKSSIFVFFSMFFRHFFEAICEGTDFELLYAAPDTESDILEPGSGVRHVPGERL